MIIAIDYDMTIVDIKGELMENAKEVINSLYDKGHTVIIWTSRIDERLTDAIDFLNKNKIKYHKVNENADVIKSKPRKVVADIYIDDKNFGSIPTWKEIGEELIENRNIKIMKNRKFTTANVRAFDEKAARETREIDFVISDASRDRHGTIIPVDSWAIQNYNKNGVVGYQHEVQGSFISNPDQVIGKGFVFIEDDKLIGRVHFEPKEINPIADKLFEKVLFGSITATSVGFIETERGAWGEGVEARDGKNPTYYFKSVELIEFSLVNIPSNPNALRRDIDSDDENVTMLRDMEETRQQLATAQLRISELETQITTLSQNLRIAKINGLQRLNN